MQGLTELLPVSSSGHLVLVEKALGLELQELSFEIGVHGATALGLCVILRRELRTMLRSIMPVGISDESRREGRLLILNIMIGTIPAAVVGLAAYGQIQTVFHDIRLTFAMLPLTGVLLIATRWADNRELSLRPRLAFLVGVAQAIAVLPGISRSGLTIGTALFLGIRKDEAVKFSFLLSLPAITAGVLREFLRNVQTSEFSGVTATQVQSPVGTEALVIGSVVAFFSAILAATALLGVVRRGKLEYFGYYCLAVGLFGFFLFAGKL